MLPDELAGGALPDSHSRSLAILSSEIDTPTCKAIGHSALPSRVILMKLFACPTLFLKRRWPSPWMAVRRMSRSPSLSKSATAARPEHHYYCCHNRRAAKHKQSTQGRKRCRLPYIRSDQLDDFIFRYTARVLRDPDLLLEHVFSEDHMGERLSELKGRRLILGKVQRFLKNE